MIFRVLDDLDDRDLSHGKLYDEDFTQLTVDDLSSRGSSLIINPVTTDQFEMLRAAREMDVPITIEVTGLTNDEREAAGL
jgi:hypothetical protein